jgi:branched-subunit amino acid transport protein AzlD
MNSTAEALGMVLAMGAVVFFCRAFPFLFFFRENFVGNDNSVDDDNKAGDNSGGRKKGAGVFLDFVERVAPPVAMTVLAFNALGFAFRDNPRDGLLALAASVFTAVLHLWKGNFLISILGGTILYMIIFPG